MFPSSDPNCQKYIDDPDREFYRGRWRTQEQISSVREYQREYQLSFYHANKNMPGNRLKKCQRSTLRAARKQLERSIARAEDL